MKHLISILIFLLAFCPGILAWGLDDIFPTPDSLTVTKGNFRISGAAFKYSSSLDETASYAIRRLASRISLVSGKASPVSSPIGLDAAAASGSVKGLVFILDDSLRDEEYSMDIQPGIAIVRAGGTAGILYSVQTLRQMLPDAIYEAKPEQQKNRWLIPCCTLRDCPDISQRAIRTDCASEWTYPSELEELFESMASVKLNTLRMVVADEDCWRIRTEALPELAQITAYREDGRIYTRDDISQLVKHAGELGIRIIPEIKVPTSLLAEVSLETLPTEVTAELESMFGESLSIIDGDNDGTVAMFDAECGSDTLAEYAQALWCSTGK